MELIGNIFLMIQYDWTIWGQIHLEVTQSKSILFFSDLIKLDWFWFYSILFDWILSNVNNSNFIGLVSIALNSWIGLNWVGSDSIQFYSIGSYLIQLIQILSDYILLNGIDWEHILNDSMRSNIMRLNSSGRWTIKFDSVIYRIRLNWIESDLILSVLNLIKYY